MSILLAEDQDSIRLFTSHLISSCGYDATMTSNASEALQVFHESPHSFQLLVTDIDMPGMNGLALAKQLLQCKPSLKVLYMSGHFPDSMPTSVPGQIDRIDKPFTVSIFQNKLHSLMTLAPKLLAV